MAIHPTGTAMTFTVPDDLDVLLKVSESVDAMIARIEAEARSYVPDVTTAKGRKAIASLSYAVSRVKTQLDDAGSAMNEAAQKQISIVNAERKKVKTRLDSLRDEVRKPLDDWEAAEADRVAERQRWLAVFRPTTIPTTIADLDAMIARVTAMEVGPHWQEYEVEAADARKACLIMLSEHLAAAQKRAADDAELVRLRAEAAERAEADRLAAERAREAAEQAAAEKARADAAKAEAERAERDAARRQEEEQARELALQEALRQAREAATRQAEREAAEREAELTRQLDEAREREASAAQAERDRIAAEEQAAADARAAREADVKHRLRILSDITEAINALALEDVPVALMEGRIPHVQVVL